MMVPPERQVPGRRTEAGRAGGQPRLKLRLSRPVRWPPLHWSIAA